MECVRARHLISQTGRALRSSVKREKALGALLYFPSRWSLLRPLLWWCCSQLLSFQHHIFVNVIHHICPHFFAVLRIRNFAPLDPPSMPSCCPLRLTAIPLHAIACRFKTSPWKGRMVAHLSNSPDFVHVPFAKIMAEQELRDVRTENRVWNGPPSLVKAQTLEQAYPITFFAPPLPISWDFGPTATWMSVALFRGAGGANGCVQGHDENTHHCSRLSPRGGNPSGRKEPSPNFRK